MLLEEALIAKIIIFWNKKIERRVFGRDCSVRKNSKTLILDFQVQIFYCTIFPVLAYYILHILEDSQRDKNHNTSMNKKKDQMLWF